MKTMTCKELGGACEKTFTAATFEEIAELSKQHGTEMYQQRDAPHLQAMQKMMDLMKEPKAMQEWMADKRQQFESLPESD